MLATVVDTEALAETIAAALVAGLGITLAFSVAILGVARFADASRDGRSVAAAAFGVLAALGFLISVAGIVAGLIVMTSG